MNSAPEADPPAAGAAASWYLLDRQDRILAVSADWDRFALSNDGQGAVSQRVVGRPLADFLTGDATRMFMDAALQAARLTGRPRRLSYRCDAPDLMRRLDMHLTPLADGQVRVTHVVVETQTRQPRMRAVRWSAAAPARWWRCSLCLRLRAHAAQPGEWLEAPASLAGPGGGSEPVLATVCPDCTQALTRALQARDPRPPG